MTYAPGNQARQEFDRFHRGRRTSQIAAPGGAQDIRKHLVQEMTQRGIAPPQARRLAANLRPGQRALDQLKWGDELVARSRTPIQNPPGFYSYLIRENVAPPEGFPSVRDPQPKEAPAGAPAGSEAAYEEYRRKQIDRYLSDRYAPGEYEALLESRSKEVRKRYRFGEVWSRENLRAVTESIIRTEAAREIPLMSFPEFCETWQPGAAGL
jgi:hypothetical protein